MHTRAFGATGMELPVIGQGTWKMGKAHQRAAEVAAIQVGVSLGMTHLDTAEMYGNGGAEEMLAAVLATHPRDRLFVVSKVLPENATYRGTLRACDASLRRLGTDHLDLYLLHWRGRHPLAETMRAMEDLVAAGKIRFLGVSNFDVVDLEEAQKALTRERLAANQVLYHLGARQIERALIPYCEAHGIAVVGYSPFGSGDFRGGKVLDRVAARHGAGVTAHQVALAFLARRAFAIPKASREAHVRANADAAELALDDEEVAAIDQAFPVGSGPLEMI